MLFSDETQRIIQNQLLIWLNIVHAASWTDINQTLKKLLQASSSSDVEDVQKYPAYYFFEPLLRNGIIEVCHKVENGRAVNNVIFYPKFNSIESIDISNIHTKPTDILENYPSINKQIKLSKNFCAKNIDITRFRIMNLDNPKEFLPVSNNSRKIGIYSRLGHPWEEKYLFTGEHVYQIADISDNPDAINVAKTFCRLHNGEKLFQYSTKTHELKIRHYSNHPILITRALILSSYEQLLKPEYNRPMTIFDYFSSVSYQNISNEVIKLIKKIYNQNSVEVCDA